MLRSLSCDSIIRHDDGNCVSSKLTQSQIYGSNLIFAVWKKTLVRDLFSGQPGRIWGFLEPWVLFVLWFSTWTVCHNSEIASWIFLMQPVFCKLIFGGEGSLSGGSYYRIGNFEFQKCWGLYLEGMLCVKSFCCKEDKNAVNMTKWNTKIIVMEFFKTQQTIVSNKFYSHSISTLEVSGLF